MKKYIVFNCISIIAIIFAYWYPVELVATNSNIKEEYALGDTIPEEVIDRLIAKYATGTKATIMKKTIYCESGYKNIQSNVVKKGVRENSWGISQIHLGYHPQVSLEKALDPEFSIKFMSDNYGKVKWYGYLINQDKCNTIYQ